MSRLGSALLVLACLGCPSGPPHAPVDLIFTSRQAEFEAVASEFESDASLWQIKVWPRGSGCVSLVPDASCFGDNAPGRLVDLLAHTLMPMAARKPYGIEFTVSSESRGAHDFTTWIVRYSPDADRPELCPSWPPRAGNGVCRIDLDQNWAAVYLYHARG